MKSVIKYLSYLIVTFFILILVALLFFLYSPKSLDWLAHKIAAPYGFKYSRLSGTILNGIEIENLMFKNRPLLNKMTLTWDLVPLLYNNLSLKQFSIDALDINNTYIAIDSFIDTNNTEDFSLPFSISINKLALHPKPFDINDVGFKSIALTGNELYFYGDGIDVTGLILNIESNISNIFLDIDIKEKHVKVKQLEIHDINAIVFDQIIKKMIAVNLHKAIQREIEPEIIKQRAGY